MKFGNLERVCKEIESARSNSRPPSILPGNANGPRVHVASSMSDFSRIVKAGDKRPREDSPDKWQQVPQVFSSGPSISVMQAGMTGLMHTGLLNGGPIASFQPFKSMKTNDGTARFLDGPRAGQTHCGPHSLGAQQFNGETGAKVTLAIPAIQPLLSDSSLHMGSSVLPAAGLFPPSPNLTGHKGFTESPLLSNLRGLSQPNPLTLPMPSLTALSAGTDLPSLGAYMQSSAGLHPSPEVYAAHPGALGTPADLPPISLPEPTDLTLTASTTTSLHIRWNPVEGLERWSHNLLWEVEFCRADDTEVLGECKFPLMVGEAPVTGLGPGIDYKIRLRLQFLQPGTASAILTSSWTTGVFSTLDVAGEPDTPPRPVVHRISSICAEVTILASPCKKADAFHCAESYLLQRIEGVLPDDNSRDDEWKSVPEVTCACSHPKFPEIVPSLEKKRVPLCGDKTYHFRVRSINSHGHSDWSEIATILPPPASTEVRVEQVKSLSASLVWDVPDGHGYDILHYHVFISKMDDETGESTKETVVPARTRRAEEDESKEDEDGKEKEKEGTPEGAVVYYHPQQLQPNCSYKVWVTTKSEAGMSDPSPEVQLVTQPLPPPLPASFGVEKIEPDSLDFSWSLRDENSSNVTAVCEVTWREVLPEELEAVDGSTAKLARNMELEERDENWSTKDIPCNEEIGGDYTCHIIGLRPDNLYAIMVRGRNGGGDGPWSSIVVQRTTVPPPQMPTSLYSSNTTSTSTTLSWDNPLDDAYPVTAYQIKVLLLKDMDDEEGSWQTINAVETGDEKERLCYVVEDLEPEQEYSFEVRALNQNGPGDSTEALKVMIKCDVPPPPAQPESSEQTSDSILLSWRPPARDNGSDILSYYLQMRQLREEEWTTVSEEITSTSVEVKCTESRTAYHFRVRAKNALGYSEWSDESMFETLPPPPPEPPVAVSVMVTHNSVTINWPHSQVFSLTLFACSAVFRLQCVCVCLCACVCLCVRVCVWVCLWMIRAPTPTRKRAHVYKFVRPRASPCAAD